MLSHLNFFMTVPFHNPNSLDGVSHPSRSCSVRILLHRKATCVITKPFFCSFDIPGLLFTVLLCLRLEVHIVWCVQISVVAKKYQMVCVISNNDCVRNVSTVCCCYHDLAICITSSMMDNISPLL